MVTRNYYIIAFILLGGAFASTLFFVLSSSSSDSLTQQSEFETQERNPEAVSTQREKVIDDAPTQLPVAGNYSIEELSKSSIRFEYKAPHATTFTSHSDISVVSYAAFDLNSDGIDEIFEYQEGSEHCGSRGCLLSIYDGKEPHPALVSNVIVQSVTPLSTVTDGFLDLALYSGLSNGEEMYSIWSYNNGSYIHKSTFLSKN